MDLFAKSYLLPLLSGITLLFIILSTIQIIVGKRQKGEKGILLYVIQSKAWIFTTILIASTSLITYFVSLTIPRQPNARDPISPTDSSNHRIVTYPIDLNIDGQQLRINEEEFQKTVKKLLDPTLTKRFDTGAKITRSQIRGLANEFGLLSETATNPHLGYLDGDIAYWSEQKLSFERLALEFSARRIVLDAAERTGVIILDQSQLSWHAEKVMGNLLKEEKQYENKRTTPK